MARKTKEETLQTYHALLDAAAKQFVERGVANTTLKDIASAAGMTRGAVYWHFDNKDAVVKALWERNADAVHAAMADLLRHIEPPDLAANFRKVVKQMVAAVVEDQGFGQILRIVILNVEYTDEQTPLQDFLRGKKEELLQAMQDGFEALKRHDAVKGDMPSWLMALSLISYMHGLIHTYLSPWELDLDLATDGDALVDVFLDAFLTKVE